MNADTQAVMDSLAEQTGLDISGPTLVWTQSAPLEIESDADRLVLDSGRLAVIQQAGVYKVSCNDYGLLRLAAANRPEQADEGNYLVNIGDIAKAALKLNQEVPVCTVAGALITLCPGEASGDGSKTKTLIMSNGEYSLYVRAAPARGMDKNHYDTLVIGAGPYGTSAALSCLSAGIDMHWVGEPIAFWLRNIQPTPLRSVRSATNIYTHSTGTTFLDFCKRHGLSDSGKIQFWEFLAYYFHLLLSFDVMPAAEKVKRISWDGRYWQVLLESWGGERMVTARNIINATGIGRHPNVPAVVRDLPASVAGHVSSFAGNAMPEGKSVAVIGGGQSAIEYAIDAARRSRVTLFVKDRLVFRNLHQPSQFLYRHLASNCERYLPWLPVAMRTRLLKYLLQGTCEPETGEALRAGNITVRENVGISAAYLGNDGRVVVEYGKSAARFDCLVAATGYYYDVRDIGYLKPVLDTSRHLVAGRYPRLDRNLMLKNAPGGMYFAGYSCLYSRGFKSQFIGGTGLLIPVILKHIQGKGRCTH